MFEECVGLGILRLQRGCSADNAFSGLGLYEKIRRNILFSCRKIYSHKSTAAFVFFPETSEKNMITSENNLLWSSSSLEGEFP